jgi:hypothetical protein
MQSHFNQKKKKEGKKNNLETTFFLTLIQNIKQNHRLLELVRFYVGKFNVKTSLVQV